MVEVLYLKMVGNEWFSRYTRMRDLIHILKLTLKMYNLVRKKIEFSFETAENIVSLVEHWKRGTSVAWCLDPYHLNNFAYILYLCSHTHTMKYMLKYFNTGPWINFQNIQHISLPNSKWRFILDVLLGFWSTAQDYPYWTSFFQTLQNKIKTAICLYIKITINLIYQYNWSTSVA